MIKFTPFFQGKVEIYTDSSSHLVNKSASEEKIISEEEIYKGHLLLVNNQYPIRSESIKSDIINVFAHKDLINGYGLLNEDIHLSEEVAIKFSEMMADAKKEGLHHFLISSGYRDFAKQDVLYQQMGASYALPPGHSEHNLGLSLDIGSTEMKMEKAPEGKWIEKNAWKYGFVLRYPKDKVAITGIQYEPWHIRYVGLPHSAIMQEKNFALEEYMAYLKEEKNLSVQVNGEKYIIQYYMVSENRTIKIPKKQKYEISGDNVEGVIVTIYES